ncbi:MAG: tRNA (adenosine(37)-N6)-threonylcarbamoyltransferase complex transferase subunit TsaD, partial [Candidatus Gracilibacteria bacterium]|nr:tRNA (adenosine(37)-N6)-threonylcarbamoyltransferase complex transferase subunit TsaD [Candidatus Gracilibacteria bacterium]
MIILAIETSCDDTSLAIFEDDKLLFMDTKSQIKIHNQTGGVVPEVAAREHANSIFDVLGNVLNGSGKQIEEIDYIGVTTNPGLMPSLLTGITLGKTIGKVLNIPLIEINHIQAHIFSNFLERKESDIKFPLVCLTVSGGHNDIYYMENMWRMEKIGTSGDDAAGESFDKVAKMMGLSYPGGPIISKLAGEYEQNLLKNPKLFPRVWLNKDEFNFSFSGLKSSVKREVDKRIKNNLENINSSKELQELHDKNEVLLSIQDKKEISYEFQNSVNEVLSKKLINSGLSKNIKTVMLAGGVSANSNLRDLIQKQSKENNLNFIFPTKLVY